MPEKFIIKTDSAMPDIQYISMLEAENVRLRQALKNIIEHQKKVGVTFGVFGATYHIAKSALEMEE